MLAGTEGHGHGQLASEWRQGLGPGTRVKRLGGWGGGQGLWG